MEIEMFYVSAAKHIFFVEVQVAQNATIEERVTLLELQVCSFLHLLPFAIMDALGLGVRLCPSLSASGRHGYMTQKYKYITHFCYNCTIVAEVGTEIYISVAQT